MNTKAFAAGIAATMAMLLGLTLMGHHSSKLPPYKIEPTTTITASPNGQ